MGSLQIDLLIFKPFNEVFVTEDTRLPFNLSVLPEAAYFPSHLRPSCFQMYYFVSIIMHNPNSSLSLAH